VDKEEVRPGQVSALCYDQFVLEFMSPATSVPKIKLMIQNFTSGQRI